MEDRLHIDLLGTFRLRYKGKAVPAMRSPRLQELLAYLVLHRERPQKRQHIAFDLWPDNPSLANLRQLLFQLRQALPESETYIFSDTNTIRWQTESPCRLDIVAFERLEEKAREARVNNDVKREISALKEAVPLYRGPLLSYCFEEWITGERNRLQETYTGMLMRLTDLLEEDRAYEAAIVYGQKLLELDPCKGSTCRRLMQLYALNEDRTSVIRTYRTFKNKIREELEIEPDAKTEELYQRITAGFRRPTGETSTGSVRAGRNGLDFKWPMIGRSEEWKVLLETWKKARTDGIQWVLIRGETGIGKSRLGRELLAYLSARGYAGARAHCYEAPRTPGYGPLSDWLRSPLFRSRMDDLDDIWELELSKLLPEYFEKQPLPGYSEPWQKRRFEEALIHAFFSGSAPILLLLEEVQWCDPETLGWFDYILNRREQVPLLVAATFRTPAGPTYAAEALDALFNHLRREHRLEVIEPGLLDRSQTTELASRVLKREISENMGGLIYRETEGNPLFIVETVRELHLLKQLRDRNDDAFVPPDKTASQVRNLPRVVSDVIAARFRYLTPESREVLGIAAAAGRDISYDMIIQCCNRNEAELVEALEILIQQNILREDRPELYNFTHDKLREIAYKELSAPRRRMLHRRLAAALQQIHADDLSPPHARLAFHAERAGKTKEAVVHYRNAAVHARNLASPQDRGMLHHALKVLDTLPKGRERDGLEFDITTCLVVSFLQRRIFDADEVFRLCERVYKLGSELGEPPPVAVLFTLGMAQLMSGDPEMALELGMVMQTLADEIEDPVAGVESCYLLGLSARIAGRISESVRWYREGLDRYKEDLRLPDMQIYELDGSIILRMESACSLLVGGDYEAAQKLMEVAQKCAESSDYRLGMASVYLARALFETLRGNSGEAREAARKFEDLEVQTAPGHWGVQVKIVQGWSMAAEGAPERGAERIEKGIERLEELTNKLDLPFFYVLYVESLTAARRYTDAKAAVDRAKESLERTGARFAEAELLRVEGELLLAMESPDTETARATFEKAIRIAQKQGAKLFEQRAAAAMRANPGRD